jgi:DNA-binding NarL/FixJ family response regulator
VIRVVIADDHRVVRDGLRYLLSQEPDIDIVGGSTSQLTQPPMVDPNLSLSY